MSQEIKNLENAIWRLELVEKMMRDLNKDTFVVKNRIKKLNEKLDEMRNKDNG